MGDPMLYQFLELLFELLRNGDSFSESKNVDLQYCKSKFGIITVNYDSFFKDRVDVGV